MLATVEGVDVVPGVDGNPGHIDEFPSRRQLFPIFYRLKKQVSTTDCRGHLVPPSLQHAMSCFPSYKSDHYPCGEAVLSTNHRNRRYVPQRFAEGGLLREKGPLRFSPPLATGDGGLHQPLRRAYPP